MIISGKTKSDIQHLIEQNTFNGISAKLKFTNWRKRNATN